LGALSEQKSRPEVTAIIAASSGSMETEEVAKKGYGWHKSRKLHRLMQL
jgi:3-dehydrosphinganine reductase